MKLAIRDLLDRFFPKRKRYFYALVRSENNHNSSVAYTPLNLIVKGPINIEYIYSQVTNKNLSKHTLINLMQFNKSDYNEFIKSKNKKIK